MIDLSLKMIHSASPPHIRSSVSSKSWAWRRCATPKSEANFCVASPAVRRRGFPSVANSSPIRVRLSMLSCGTKKISTSHTRSIKGLIFLDEPTTGLDSYNSLGVMDRLATLAAHNRAVVCTIHQACIHSPLFYQRANPIVSHIRLSISSHDQQSSKMWTS